ncbi:MAG: Rieske 2Fe-2S domain-containing protein [Thermoproteota archaeon]|nr:Rieske 2Fe-2S domain-containing protein [Thermoproteota archaeon]
MEKDQFVDISKVDEIPAGKMKHVEVNGKEIVIANMNGKFCALDDRCAHMNAPLSMGNLTGDVVTCPFHGAKFNVASGKKISEPVLTPSQEMEPLPKTWQKAMEHIGQLMSHIKTYDQSTYEIKVGGTIVKAKI